MTETSRLERSLRNVLEAVSSATSEEFFPAMTRELAREVGADALGISELLRGGRARTLAFIKNGELSDSLIYDLAGTPCSDVLRKKVCTYRSGISELFPGDVLLKQERYEGFAGVPLFGLHKKPVGTMVALFRHPLDDEAHAGTILEIFSTRAASEIERLKAEKALRESEQTYRDLVETSRDLIWRLDKEGRFVFLNKSWEQTLGYTISEMLKRRFSDFQTPETALRDKEKFEELLAGGVLIGYETSCRARRGKDIYLVFNARPIRDAAGCVIGAQGTAFDFSRHKKADEALRESDRLLHESQRAGQIGSYAFNVPRGTWRSSAVFDELLGIDRDYSRDFEGWLFLVHPGDRVGIKQHLLDAIRTGRRFDREYKIVRPSDGQERWVHGQGDFELDTAGIVVKMTGIIQDITERKKTEAQLNQAQKMEAIGQLAGGVAHDFNNILSAIMGYASLISVMDLTDETMRDYVEQIKASAERGAGLTRSLLALSRKQEISFQSLDINGLIRSSEKMLSRLIGEDITLKLDLDPGNPEIEGDANQIHQVLINLATNARDAMPEGGILRIRTRAVDRDQATGIPRGEKQLVLTMGDTGSGLRPGSEKHIFEPFFTTKRSGHGTGLGLAIVYGIVQKHQGTISVESEPGKGTDFHLNLPLSFKKSPLSAGLEKGDRREVHETILLMEDEESVRRPTKLALEAYGFRVIEAEDGERGVELFRERDQEIDLLLCDLVMPKKNGREAYEEIRRIRPDVKAIFLSGYTKDIFETKGIEEKDLHLLAKPIMPSNLIKVILEALAPAASRPKKERIGR